MQQARTHVFDLHRHESMILGSSDATIDSRSRLDSTAINWLYDIVQMEFEGVPHHSNCHEF